MDDAVQLADMIWQLRSELSRAMWAGENTDLRFEAETVGLELTVGIEKSREPGVGVRFWVLDMSTATRNASTITQKITLTLRPFLQNAPGRPATISGAEMPEER